MSSFTIKTTVHTIRFTGESSVNKKNFGEKYIIFTIDKNQIKEREIYSKMPYKPGGFNKNLIVLNGYCKDILEESTVCEITFDIDNISYDNKYKSYSIKVDKIKKLLEISEDGLKRYLKLKYKGLGEKLAIKIYDFLITKYTEVESKNFKILFEKELKELSPEFKKLLGQKKSISLQQQILIDEEEKNNEITLTDEELVFCSEYNITPKTILRLKKQIIKAAINKKSKKAVIEYKDHSVIPYLKKTPYLLAIDNKIKNFGFKAIDKQVLKMLSREEMNDKDFKDQRMIGYLKYILTKGTEEGNLFIDKITLYNAYLKANEEIKELQFDIEEDEEEMFTLISEKIVTIDEDINPFIIYDNKIFLKESLKLELEIAKKLLKMRERKINIKEEQVEKALKEVEPKNWKLSSEQREAIKFSIMHPISIITGGPGTGKTTISNMVIQVLKKLNKSVKILAPTGTAAKRISVVVKEEATTIHRGLGFKGYFEFNEDNPLREDVVIIDEVSMVDVFLGKAVINASVNSQIIFIGDVNQLPSVGPGDFLRDMINSNKFNVSMLTNVFRQAEDNPIIQFAYKVNRGAEVKELYEWYTRKEDVLDIKFSIPFKEHFKKNIKGEENPQYLENMLLNTIELGFKTYLLKAETIFDAQILVASNRANDRINTELQTKLNETGEIIEGTIFKVGDKIIQIKNNYNLNIFNGSIGIIQSYNKNTEEIFVSYMENRNTTIAIEKKVFMKENKLCYSMTIHKSQGQEFSRVIMLINDYMLNNREMLYTGATRAKDYLTIVTNTDLLRIGIATTNKKGIKGQKNGKKARKTYLMDFLTQDLSQINNALEKNNYILEPTFD